MHPMEDPRKVHNAYQQSLFASEVQEYCEEIPVEVQRKLRRIVGCAGVAEGDRVLDVGTGTGVLIPFFRELGVGEIVGCDLSEDMLRHARDRFPDVLFWSGDVIDLPERFGRFDAVFFNAMFGNVFDQGAALRAVTEVLNAGGRICVSHPLGSGFVAGLHRADPRRVPSLLPEREKWARLVGELPLLLSHFEDEAGFYVAVLTAERR